MDIKIKDLNGLRRFSHVGLYKQGHCVSFQKYQLACDYLEKINYSLQDITTELQKTPSRSSLICIVAYACWIQESITELKKCYRNYVFENLSFDETVIEEDDSFLKAIRSFVLTHPLTTTRHKDYGFDGTLYCVDIRVNGSNTTFPFVRFYHDKYYIDTKGKSKYNNQEIDYWLYVYNNNDNSNFGYINEQYIGISIDTICKVVNDYIDYLYALDRHMSKINIQKET